MLNDISVQSAYHFSGEKPSPSLFQVVSWVTYFIRLTWYNSE